MADTDFNIIRPVDTLHNVPGLTPIQDREERKRRQNTPAGRKEPPKEPKSEKNEQAEEHDDDTHSIDYCA